MQNYTNMKSFKILLLIFSFISIKAVNASEIKYELVLSKIYKMCQNYYADDSACKCVLNMTIQQIKSGISLLTDNSPDSQIDAHVRGTKALCEMDMVKQRFN